MTDKIKIVSFKEHKCSTVTAKRDFDENGIKIYEIAKYIPVVYLRDENNNIFHLHGKKIPFYFVNGIILSSNYKEIQRGIRKRTMENMYGIDIQIFDRNIHVKISSKNMTCVGPKNIEEVDEVFDTICDIIENLKENFLYMYSLDTETVDKNLKWFYNNLTDSTEQMLDKIDANINIDKRFLTTLALYIDDCNDLSKSIKELVDDIFEHKPIFFESDKLVGSESEINNSVFYLNIFKEPVKRLEEYIMLFDLAKFLLEMGITVVYINTTGKLNICFDIEEEKIKNKNYKHRFSLHNTGTLRQTSPTSHEESYECYKSLMTCIKEYYEYSSPVGN